MRCPTTFTLPPSPISGRLLAGLTARPACPQAQQQGRLGQQLTRGCVVARAFNLDDLMLDVPEIDGDIKSLQVEMGAIFNVSKPPVRQLHWHSAESAPRHPTPG